jgi:lysophospholipase L1-like esterase
MKNFTISDGDTILFIGDSITDCGRRDTHVPLGDGYVSIFSELVTGRYPERDIRYINKGIGGNTVVDLQRRWHDDVLRQRPDKLVIKVGINDLYGHMNNVPDLAVPPDLYAAVFDELLQLTQSELGCPVLLLTPFYISTDKGRPGHRKTVLDLLPAYIGTVERMAEKYDTGLVNLQDIFQRHLEFRDPDYFCPEPVHPSRPGHLVMALALFDACSDGGH